MCTFIMLYIIIYTLHVFLINRHPEANSRPTFNVIEAALNKLKTTLSSLDGLGSPLDTGYSLYPDLQNMFKKD